MSQIVNYQNDPNAYVNLHNLYYSCGIKQVVSRHCEYLREHPYGTFNGAIAPISLVVTGGALGFMTGSMASEKVDSKPGKVILQSIGVVAGGISGALLYVKIKENNLFFKTWKFLKMEAITNEMVAKRFENDEFLNKFLDCIHYSSLSVPVRLPTGHLVDLNTLKQLRQVQDGIVTCPHTRQRLDTKNPNIDLELYVLIKKRHQFLLKQELAALDPSSMESQSISSQLDVIEKQLCLSHQKHLKGLYNLHSSGKISDVEMNRLVAKFYENFGVDPIGNPDEENDIKVHIMDFDKDWKRILTNNSKIIFRGNPETQFVDNV